MKNFKSMWYDHINNSYKKSRPYRIVKSLSNTDHIISKNYQFVGIVEFNL